MHRYFHAPRAELARSAISAGDRGELGSEPSLLGEERRVSKSTRDGPGLSGLDAAARIEHMVHLLDPTAAGFLMAENRRMPMHVGGLQLFSKPEGAGRNFVRDLYTQLRESEDIAPLFLKHPQRSIKTARPVGVGRGRRLRHRVPRATQRPAEARPGARAARAVLAPALHPPRDRATAVGVAPDRGAARRPGRDVLQAPPRPGRRHLRDAAAPEHPQHRRRAHRHAGAVGEPAQPFARDRRARARRRTSPSYPHRRCAPRSASAPRRPASPVR